MKPLVIAAALFIALCTILHPYIPDDAYISFRYAQNLSSGDGLTFNPGERVEGYSNFLWILACALMLKIGLGIKGCVALGVMFGVLTLWQVWKLNERAVLYAALAVPFAMYAVSGMETALFSFLLVTIFVYFWKWNWKLFTAAGIGLALCRPEGLVILPLLCLLSLVMKKGTIDKNMAMAAGVFLGVMIVYHFWRVSYFGEWLPAPFVSKCLALPDRWNTNFTMYFQKCNGRFAPFGYFYVGLAIMAVASARWKLLALVPLAGLYFSTPDWMPAMRYFVPFIPILMAMIDVKRWRPWLCGALILAAMLGYHDRVTMKDHMAKTMEMTNWIKASQRPGDVLAISDAGLVPYYTGMETIDIAPKPLLRREVFDMDSLLFQQQPRWIVMPSVTAYNADTLRLYTEHRIMYLDPRFRALVYRSAIFYDMPDRSYLICQMDYTQPNP